MAGKTASIMIAAAVCMTSICNGMWGTAWAADSRRSASQSDCPNDPANVAKRYVQFGSYWQEDTNGDGKADESDAKTPITWRVLWSSSSQAIIMSEQCLDARAFHDKNEKVTWKNCDLRTWLNSTFIGDAFNAKEQAAIVEKEIVTEGDSFMENKEDITTKDKVFVPSVADMTSTSYGYDGDSTARDSARTATNTAYCAAKSERDGTGQCDTYWLRNSGQSNDEACAVNVNGVIEYLSNVDYQGHGIRPMLYLNMEVEDSWTEADSQTTPANPSQTASPSMPPAENIDSAVKSDNLHKNEYPYYAAQTVNSYLRSISENLYERAEYTGDKIIIETYDKKDFQIQSGKNLAMELPLFGGIYSGSKYNFIVYGQENLKEDDNTEVIRICKYDKAWNRLGSGSIFGANTIRPFRSGSLRMCESGDMLYIRTCHQMYASDDGLNHQANMTIAFKQSDATVTDYFSKVWNINTAGYVSHSFNQFIKIDGKDIVAADHGDAYPRSFVLVKFSGNAGGERVTVNTTPLELNKFTGASGENYTGAELGGLEISSSHYLVAGNSVDQESDYSGKVRNVYLYAVDKSDFTSDGIKVRQITNYVINSSVSASAPYIAKLEQDRFIMVWEEITPYASGAFYPKITCSKTLKYVLLDGQGNAQGDIKSVSGCLSDCEPFAENGVLSWYVTEDDAPTFYQLNVEKGITVGSANPTGTPDTSSKPGVSSKPDTSLKPGVSSKPDTSSKPGVSSKPDTGSKPQATTEPNVTKKPSSNSSGYDDPTPKPQKKKVRKVTKKPSRVKIKKIKNIAKGRAKVTWGKVKCNYKYEVQVGYNKKFSGVYWHDEVSKSKKTYTFKTNLLKDFSSKKTLYVRIRAMNYGYSSKYADYKTWIYGKWSKIKKIKIKK